MRFLVVVRVYLGSFCHLSFCRPKVSDTMVSINSLGLAFNIFQIIFLHSIVQKVKTIKMLRKVISHLWIDSHTINHVTESKRATKFGQMFFVLFSTLLCGFWCVLSGCKSIPKGFSPSENWIK